ncbi:MAG: hypothetical protein COU85_01225 [Candidatus Portnoybacteria bacterium CG10_big_fil_rev_8_21_14_0_10_44_7]|uniref:Sortase n=1 Tax=Candidatus Portnoybacteria bacterium CG10_big_fil_rev_8_21_14_0_10_44_7 TaxID=1974816 RepID=A0A2M8KIZ1_9BACT|nr:MAG: hypothetical protein COU85_01225 [Candidatus Portnoybacteria bacterium CG10_big_fil_rev_8_21_14_0_10_44_7]
MSKNSQKQTNRELLGALPAGILTNFILGVFAIVLTAIFNGPRINIPFWLALILFIFFLLAYFYVSLRCIIALPTAKMGIFLVKSHPYNWSRHPMYASIIFLLNPALAFLLRSWLVLLFIIPAYLAWKIFTRREERELVQKFGTEYISYQKEAAQFFPNLLKISQPLFFVFWGLIFLLLALILVNFSSFAEKFIIFEASYQVNVLDKKLEPKISAAPTIFKAFSVSPFEIARDRFYATIFSLTPAGYRAQAESGGEVENTAYLVRLPSAENINKIEIGKINVSAPLVFPQGAKEKDINYALDNGVIVYPGSVLPPDFGNLFLTGHSSVYFWNKTPYGQIFSQLYQLTKGDKITIHLNGYAYEYVVTESTIKKADRVELAQYINRHSLTLMTCWPVGTANKRLVVTAELVSK